MPWKLTVTGSLDLTDNDGNPIGQSYPITAVQVVGAANPQAIDLTNAATAIGTAIGASLSPFGGTLGLEPNNE